MRKRWVKILLIAVGAVVVIAGGLLLVLQLTSPPSFDPAGSSIQRELPADWFGPAPQEEPSPSPQTPSTTPDAVAGSDTPADPSADPDPASIASGEPAPVTGRAPFEGSGSLIAYSDGRPFAQESYRVELDAEGGTLRSSGQFQFKVVLATLRVTFEQELSLDGTLLPISYLASYDAPLGMDREILVEIEDGTARIASGAEDDDRRTKRLTDNTVFLGTFSTYALLPYLARQQTPGATAQFDVLVLGGPPGEEEGSEDALPSLQMSPSALRQIEARGQTLSVDAYTVSSPLGESLLLAKGDEFLAFLAGGDEGSLVVLRSDLFPDGFVLTGAPTSAGLRSGPYP